MDKKEYLLQSGIGYDQALGLFGQADAYFLFLSRFAHSPLLKECLEAYAAKDYEKAWKRAHTLKGTALNLYIPLLGELCQSFIKNVQKKDYESAAVKLQEMEKQYAQVCDIINNLDNI